MNHTSKLTVLPALTTDLLQDSGILIDNVFATLWQQIGMKTLLNRSGFTKRSGIPIHEVVYTLSLWLWLKKESIWMFACDSLQGMGKDVLYDTLNREDLNWRKYLMNKLLIKRCTPFKQRLNKLLWWMIQ